MDVIRQELNPDSDDSYFSKKNVVNIKKTDAFLEFKLMLKNYR